MGGWGVDRLLQIPTCRQTTSSMRRRRGRKKKHPQIRFKYRVEKGTTREYTYNPSINTTSHSDFLGNSALEDTMQPFVFSDKTRTTTMWQGNTTRMRHSALLIPHGCQSEAHTRNTSESHQSPQHWGGGKMLQVLPGLLWQPPPRKHKILVTSPSSLRPSQ